MSKIIDVSAYQGAIDWKQAAQEIDGAYNMGFSDGYSKGRYEVLNTIAEILKQNKYPEYLEEDVYDYLVMEGVIHE